MKHKVEIRNGDDWVEVFIDGKSWYAAHSLSEHDLVELLRDVGVECEMPDGDFCSMCCKWTTEELDYNGKCSECTAKRENSKKN